MYKLIQASDRGCCIQSPAKIGLVRLEGQTGRRIYAPGIECAFTRRLILEPSFLYGGQPPPSPTQNPLHMSCVPGRDVVV